MKKSTVHHGRNVKHLRGMLGVKQDALAGSMGISQQKYSNLFFRPNS